MGAEFAASFAQRAASYGELTQMGDDHAQCCTVAGTSKVTR